MKIGTFYKNIINIYDEQKYSFELVALKDYDDPKTAYLDGIIAGRMSNEQIKSCTNLKRIYIPFTGKNGFDENYLKQKGIEIFACHIHAKYVAERALTLTLAILSKVPFYDKQLRKGDWAMRIEHPWHSLFGKRVGIYGYGTIGQWIHRLVEPFGCSVMAYNRSQAKEVDYANSLADLVENSDIVFVAVPLTDDTLNSVDKEILSLMSDKVLVNVGRGAVVHEKHLYDALKSGSLWGYASDVWYNYPKADELCPPTQYPIQDYNVVMTPHNAGFTDNSERERLEDTLARIESHCLE